jgi:cytochrome c biogenesis protein CcmG/thiol:disulfide interchange protein DsbE
MSNRPNPSTRASAQKRHVQAAQRKADSSRTTLIVAGAVILVGIIAIVAIIASRSSGSGDATGGGASPSGGTVVPNGDLVYGTVNVQGQALPKLGQGQTRDPAIGQVAPTVVGQQFDESSLTIGADGKPKLVMFLAHWCPHCQAEVPRIQEWLDDNGMPSNVELYAVTTDTTSTRGNFPPASWLRKQGWSVPTIADDEQSSAGQAYGLGGFPFFVVVGADGKVVYRTSGELTIEQFQALLDAARTGTPPDLTGGASSPAG